MNRVGRDVAGSVVAPDRIGAVPDRDLADLADLIEGYGERLGFAQDRELSLFEVDPDRLARGLATPNAPDQER